MTDQIDWKRDKAQVTPEYHGACWKQGGKFYDQEGERVRVPGEPPDPEPGTEIAKTNKPRSRRERVKEARSGESSMPERQQPAKAGEVDLNAWAHGRAKYRFGEVREAIRKKYAHVPSEQRGAIDILISEGVVTLDAAAKAFPGLKIEA